MTPHSLNDMSDPLDEVQKTIARGSLTFHDCINTMFVTNCLPFHRKTDLPLTIGHWATIRNMADTGWNHELTKKLKVGYSHNR